MRFDSIVYYLFVYKIKAINEYTKKEKKLIKFVLNAYCDCFVSNKELVNLLFLLQNIKFNFEKRHGLFSFF